MSEYENIASGLLAKKIKLVGSIIEDSNDSGVLFVRIAVTRDAENRQQPSNHLLAAIKAELSPPGKSIEFLLTDEQGQDIEAGLRATLIHAFGNEIRNVFASIDGPTGHAWIEPKRDLDETEISTIRHRSSDFLNSVGIRLEGFVALGDENLPGNIVMLKILRLLAPATLQELKAKLQEKFTIPSDDWLKRRLDQLRKAGKVVWLAGDKYACTLSTIRTLGSARGRLSPDLSRLLALARQGS